MKISIACPTAVHADPKKAFAALESVATADHDWAVFVEGALLTFHFMKGDPKTAIESIDASLGLAIADADDPAEILALSQLKAALGEVQRQAQRESSYSDARYVTAGYPLAEATDDTAASHLQGEQHTSTDDSSEQHGVAPEDEENENESQEEQEEPRSRKRR